jgi:hypothetical protein
MNMILQIAKKTVLILFVICIVSCSQKRTQADLEKQLYIPAKVEMVPDSNDYDNPESDFSFSRMIQTPNLALFWHKEYGQNPMENADTTRRFDPKEAINECERFYKYYVNDLKIVEKGKSLTDTFKMLIYVFGGDIGTAFGGGEEEKVGILWTPAVRINKKPYGALAHELAHSFQYISSIDAGTGPSGPIMEMSAQYMLWQVYPEWMTFENYHLEAFMKQTHLAFLHPANMYHSAYVLEYWAEKHGKEFFGELSRKTQEGEDPVDTYKRIYNLTQDAFNDEIFEGCRKFITWDLKRVNEVAKKYANQHITKLDKSNNGYYRIDSAHCPQNYGYNGIRLEVPAKGTEVSIQFEGIAGMEGYSKEKLEKAGWRYGFVASLKDGSRVYSDVYNKNDGTATFTVPENTAFLWFVVSGAPTEHFPVFFRWVPPQPDDPKEEQWPYQFKIDGTRPVDEAVKS